MTFAKSERAELCDLFDKVGPHAPTLCEGWDTHDLAAHLWIRETDPVGASGIVAKPLSSLSERRMAEIKQRWEYPELVDRVRRGPARFSIFAIPGVDEGANTTEFFIHHEDVRRAGDSPQTSRQLGDDVEEWMWRRLKLLGPGLVSPGSGRRRPGAPGFGRRRRRAGDHQSRERGFDGHLGRQSQ